MRRLLVNDALNQLGEHTFWNDLMEWFGMEFIGGDYQTLADVAYRTSVYKVADEPASLIIRNATWFPPIKTDTPTICLLQDIVTDGPLRTMQEAVIKASRVTVFNSAFTAAQYGGGMTVTRRGGRDITIRYDVVIPLPVDFSLFAPQNPMGCQQALGLPDGCVCWIGASQGAAAQVKGYDTFCQIVRTNPDIPFVAVFKDAAPEYTPPNLRSFVRLSHPELVQVIGACRVGLCTSRTESQHLAGIEMGACGLPMVAPPVGVYWNRSDFPGSIISGDEPRAYAVALRNILSVSWMPEQARTHWQREFDKPVIKAAWENLVAEVEAA